MDMSKFVKSLSNSEISELQKFIDLEKNERLSLKKAPPLSDEELKILSSKGKVSTILAYRLRTNQTVIVSKFVVESYCQPNNI